MTSRVRQIFLSFLHIDIILNSSALKPQERMFIEKRISIVFVHSLKVYAIPSTKNCRTKVDESTKDLESTSVVPAIMQKIDRVEGKTNQVEERLANWSSHARGIGLN